MQVRAIQTLFYQNVLRNRGELFEWYGSEEDLPPSMTADIEAEVLPVASDRFGMPVIPAPVAAGKGAPYSASQAATQATVDSGTGKASKHK